ncbi:MAG: alpha/beta hydrolase, partial [Eubacteriales bacterium]
SNDGVLDRTQITYTQNIVVLQGGNHAQFGNYGLQQGDGTATISRESQQNQTADAIAGFIHAKVDGK